MRRRLGAMCGFLAIFFFGCSVGVTCYQFTAPTPPLPVYSARGLSDIIAAGEPLPRRCVLHTQGFSDTDPPAYYPRFPGPAVLVLDAKPPLPARVVARVHPGTPVRLTLGD